MKKITLFFFSSILCAQISLAQTTLTTAVDFTATDINGNTFNLFNTLATGKYVVLDFMFTTCGPCQQCAPKLFGAFFNYGCNSSNAPIQFVSINRDDNNAVMHSWESTYMNPSGPYPIGISGTQGSASAGAQSFYATYGIPAFPTMILIAPNHQILEQDMWPITDASTFDSFFQPHGISQMPCTSGITSLDNANDLINIAPVPASDVLSISSNGANINTVSIINTLGQVMFTKAYSPATKQDILNVAELEAGIYFIEMRLNETTVVKKKFVKIASK